MPLIGSIGLALAAFATLVSIACLFIATRQANVRGVAVKQQLQKIQAASKMQSLGLVLVLITTLALTICCALLVIGFLGGDNSIEYVAQYRSNSVSDFALLYKLSGLWAGREGSLLFWAWLISVFNAVVALKAWRSTVRITKSATETAVVTSAKTAAASIKAPATSNESDTSDKAPVKTTVDTSSKTLATNYSALDSAALAISQLVLLIFMALLLFDKDSMPFVATPAEVLDASGALTSYAALWGMNTLLEHWAMAIHPPTLFVGYAGMTIPFAYAVAALVTNDPSRAWINRATRYTLFSWLFLGIGIGLGAVWAYVVLGWGGYWGWDPVENASLLPWCAGVALVHSMTLYKQRGIFKRWTIMLACLTFAFVILGTFITRSGIINSVHAFQPNMVATILFGLLMVLPLLAGAIGLIRCGVSFSDPTDDETEYLLSKDIAYYFNNVIVIVCTLVITYMTVSSVIPELFFLPGSGQTLTAPAFNAIARPVGIVYALLIALGPLLGWKKTDGKAFLRQARVPALLAVLLFVVLCVFFVNTLLPIYMQIMGQGGTAAAELAGYGPFLYYAGLTLVGFLAASLLFFNALFMLVRALAKRNLRAQTIGGFTAHLAMGVLLIGLIGSSMYSIERTTNLVKGEQLTIRNYTLSNPVASNELLGDSEYDDEMYTLTMDVARDGVPIGQVSPQVQLYIGGDMRLQYMNHAAVINLPLEDFFVVYNDISAHTDGPYSLSIHINPLINLVWLGFALLMIGTALATFGRRDKKAQASLPEKTPAEASPPKKPQPDEAESDEAESDNVEPEKTELEHVESEKPELDNVESEKPELDKTMPEKTLTQK